MKDFKIAGYDYAKSCAIAKKCGIMPLEKPDENLIMVFDTVATQCLERVSFGADDMKLAGLYLYRAAEQKEFSDRCSFGLTSPDAQQEKIIIGLAVELFERGTPEFYRIVFLHECAHGFKPAMEVDGMKHGELFTMRLNGIMMNYYCSEQYQYHADSAGVSGRKVWTM